ncbi:MAG: LysM peptidoglycan-binding domain-containing protein [Planctomycetota bacterium]
MKTSTLTTLCLLATLAAAGCNQVNRIYEQDTGDLAPVPGPPAADVAEPIAAADDSGTVEFVEPESIDGIQPLPEDAPTPVRTYTVQKGDSFWKIAQSVYGSGARAADIAAANPGLDPQRLTIGTEIVLPD